jgi:hypothetical protein
MMIKSAFFFAGVLLVVSLGCKKTDPTDTPEPTPVPTTPTSMAGTWKITGLGLAPAWPKVVNGKTVLYTDYVTFLKDINETCLTDVVFTFAAAGGVSSNIGTRPTCGNGAGPNSRFVVEYLVEEGGTYVESTNQLDVKGKDNVTHLLLDKTYSPGSVKLTWKLDRDMSNELVATTYSLTLTKQ